MTFELETKAPESSSVYELIDALALMLGFSCAESKEDRWNDELKHRQILRAAIKALTESWTTKGNLIEQQAKGLEVLRAAMPDLNPVIYWLQNKCAINEAIAELEIHRGRVTKALTGQ